MKKRFKPVRSITNSGVFVCANVSCPYFNKKDDSGFCTYTNEQLHIFGTDVVPKIQYPMCDKPYIFVILYLVTDVCAMTVIEIKPVRMPYELNKYFCDPKCPYMYTEFGSTIFICRRYGVEIDACGGDGIAICAEADCRFKITNSIATFLRKIRTKKKHKKHNI
jgi:hypothetical protein